MQFLHNAQVKILQQFTRSLSWVYTNRSQKLLAHWIWPKVV